MSKLTVVLIALAVLLVPTSAGGMLPGTAQAQESGCQPFPETGKSACGKFLEYWQAHGGLAQQGYPISNEMPERSDTDGKTYTVQYFERAVFEAHPENKPPYDVLLSLLGSFEYKRKYPNGAPGQQPDTSPGSILYPETGKRLGGKFLAYWQAHGALAQQGYPISDPFTERSELDGKSYTVQYFERAVFEAHPENKAPYDVLLSQLGTFQLQRKLGPAASSTPEPTATPLPLNPAHIDLPVGTGRVFSIAWSPDGELLASGPESYPPLYPTSDFAIKLWKPDGSLATTLSGHAASVYSLAWSPDGQTLASGSADGVIKLWNRDGSLRKTMDTQMGVIFVLAWSPDGKTLASGPVRNPTTNRVQLWASDGTLLKTLTTQYSGGKFYNLAWSPNGEYLLGGATDYKVWRADGTEVYHLLRGEHGTPSWGMAWSPDSSRWAIGNESGVVTVYTPQGDVVGGYSARSSVNTMAWSPDGTTIAVGNTVDLLGPDASYIVTLSNTSSYVDSLAWSLDSKMLAAGDDRGGVRIWSKAGSPLARLTNPAEVTRAAWSPDGSVLAAAGGPTLRLWKIR